jgi:RimJ/RimL family protein N-acetyltransferase
MEKNRNDSPKKIMNDVTIEVISKSIFKETNRMGFEQTDYIKLINQLLDLSLNKSFTREEFSEIDYRKFSQKKLPLKGDNIVVREFDVKKDSPLLKSWLSGSQGNDFLLSSPPSRHITDTQLIESEQTILSVIELKDKTPIGLLGFLDCDKNQNKAELRKIIGEAEYREKGFAKEASKLWIAYGINTLGLKKIYLNTIETNMRNIRLNQELGFSIEGIFRDECFFDGKYFDVLRMALITG